jgi:DNA-binding transcriptional MerR regulator
MKIGDVTAKYGISHHSLHYWESAGILKSSRAENDYRYYDEENLLKVKQIVLLRKLRISIPSIQEIFASNELSKVIEVFTAHLENTKKEAQQLNALGTVLRQLLNMLKDRQNIDSVYNYLEINHSTESDELKAALKTVLSEPVKEINIEPISGPVIDMAGIDLSLELMKEEEIPDITEVIKRCYSSTEHMDKLLLYWDFRGFNMPDCRWFYKIMQDGQCIGAINLAYVGMEAMLIRNLAYIEPDNNIYVFELLKRIHPNIECWMIRNSSDNLWGAPEEQRGIDDFNYDWEEKKQRFWEDNGFVFYTNARYNQFIKMMRPHDDVYNSSKYRFALLDNSMDGVSFRFFGVSKLDWYDGKMTDWRITDCNFSNALIYDTWMGDSKFFDSGLGNSVFQYVSFDHSIFNGGSFNNCKISNCNISGMTIDGINVEEALKYYKKTRYID